MNTRDRYDPARDVSPKFLDQVTRWIERTGEVLVILRYLRSAGAKDYAHCRTAAEFEELVDSVPPGTDIEVFRDPQLPSRGVVDEAFITSASRMISGMPEYLLISAETRAGSRVSRMALMDNCPAELRQSLLEMMGVEVAFGPCPDFNAPDHEGLISASKGGIDGPR